MSNCNIISPFQAAQMADAAYALKNHSVEVARSAGAELTGGNNSIQVCTPKMTAKTGGIFLNQSSGFGYCAKSADGKTAYIVVRGTKSLADAVTDVNVIPCSTGFGTSSTLGFVNAFKSFEQRVSNYLQGGSFTTVHCIGHSLGGALATLTANKLIHENPNMSIKLYTFGSPRVFYTGGSKMENVESYRVFHKTDPVTMLGPYPLTHYDEGYNVGNSNILNPVHHSMESSYLPLCKDKTWTNLHTPVSDNCINVGLSWMFRKLQKILLYGLTLGLGGAFAGTATIVDVLYALLQKGKELSSWVINLLKQMARFVKNGWTANNEKSDDYFKAKQVIFNIIDLFLIKITHAAEKSLDITRNAINSGADAIRKITPILLQGSAVAMGSPIPPIFYL